MTRMISWRALCVSAAIAMMTIAGAVQAQDKLTGTAGQLQALSGRYADPQALDWGRGTFGRRDFTFENGRWTLSFVLALDPKFEHKVFSFRTLGSFKISDASRSVPGAYEADFTEEKKFVTLLTTDAKLAQSFGLAACNLNAGEEKDISVSGCALWKPVSVCGQDHDLLALDSKGQLYFGVRPPDNDLCASDKRPTSLLPPVVKR